MIRSDLALVLGMRHYRGMKPVTDASIADWLVDAMHPFAQDVGSVIPPGFEAYARVFHPAGKGDEDWEAVRWTDIARANGKADAVHEHRPARVFR